MKLQGICFSVCGAGFLAAPFHLFLCFFSFDISVGRQQDEREKCIRPICVFLLSFSHNSSSGVYVCGINKAIVTTG